MRRKLHLLRFSASNPSSFSSFKAIIQFQICTSCHGMLSFTCLHLRCIIFKPTCRPIADGIVMNLEMIGLINGRERARFDDFLRLIKFELRRQTEKDYIWRYLVILGSVGGGAKQDEASKMTCLKRTWNQSRTLSSMSRGFRIQIQSCTRLLFVIMRRTCLMAGPAPVHARHNLAATFVNAYDKLMPVPSDSTTGSSGNWLFKNKEDGKTCAAASLGMTEMWEVDSGLAPIRQMFQTVLEHCWELEM